MTAPADVVWAVFDRHTRWGDTARCQVCGQPEGAPECPACVAAEEAAAKRREDH